MQTHLASWTVVLVLTRKAGSQKSLSGFIEKSRVNLWPAHTFPCPNLSCKDMHLWGKIWTTAMSAVPKSPLTHWGRVMHICVGNLTIISSDNDLSPGWCLAIIWTNAGILLIGRIQCRNKLRWNFNQNYNIFVQENVFESVVWKTIREDRRVYLDPDYCEATHPQCDKSFEGNYSKHPCFFVHHAIVSRVYLNTKQARW